MKTFATLVVIMMLWNISSGQQCNVRYLQKSKKDIKEIVFVSPSTKKKDAEKNKTNELFSNILKLVLEKNWKLNVPYKILSEDDAYTYGKEKEGVMLAEFAEKSPMGSSLSSHTANEFRIIVGNEVTVKAVIQVFLSKRMAEADIVYAINSAQFMFENSDKFKSKDIFEESAKLYGSMLESKTLLIPEGYKSEKLTDAEIKKYYPYSYKVVSSKEIQQAIITKDEKLLVAYDMHVLAESGYTLMAWVVYQPSNGAVVTYATDRPTMMRVDFSKRDLKLFVENKD